MQRPRRVVVHKVVVHKVVHKRVDIGDEEFGVEIDFEHELSDGFGIPSVVVGCPIESKFSEKYKGYDEYGDKIEGISFDDCESCPYFGGLGYGQEIICFYKKAYKKGGKHA